MCFVDLPGQVLKCYQVLYYFSLRINISNPLLVIYLNIQHLLGLNCFVLKFIKKSFLVHVVIKHQIHVFLGLVFKGLIFMLI